MAIEGPQKRPLRWRAIARQHNSAVSSAETDIEAACPFMRRRSPMAAATMAKLRADYDDCYFATSVIDPDGYRIGACAARTANLLVA